IDWQQWARPDAPLVPTPWNGSYLQMQMSQGQKDRLKAVPDPVPSDFPYLLPPLTQNWDGAMTTIQRYSTDPLLNNQGEDRTVSSDWNSKTCNSPIFIRVELSSDRFGSQARTPSCFKPKISSRPTPPCPTISGGIFWQAESSSQRAVSPSRKMLQLWFRRLGMS